MSEKTDVVEVVATFFARHNAAGHQWPVGNGDREAARAALSAIPVTEGMVEAGARVMCEREGDDPDAQIDGPGGEVWVGWYQYAERFQAAIQAALKAAVEG